MTLTPTEYEHLLDYLEEITTLIEADDGDIFTLPFLNKHETIWEIVHAIAER